MREARLRSKRKFCPSDFLATRPCRRITSRNGGRPSEGIAHDAASRHRPRGAWRGPGEPRRQPQRGDQARRIGGAGAGDVEGGAVIRRGAHERQAERDVDGMIEGERLDRDQRLIVIHAERRVIVRARPFMKHRIGGKRTPGIDPFGDEARHRRRDDRAILLAERTLFAGMRIEPGDREPRTRELKAREQGRARRCVRFRR